VLDDPLGKSPFSNTITLTPRSAAVIDEAIPAPPVPKTAASAFICFTVFTCSIFSLRVKEWI
jgi:hypothetical protein